MLLLLAGTLYVLWRFPQFTIPKHAFWILLGIAFLVRLLPNALLAETSNFDIDSFYLAGEVLSKGDDVYTNEATQNRHPYLPFQMYALEGAYRIANSLGWPFPFTVRLLPLSIDAVIAAWLFLSLRRTFPDEVAFRWGMVYALNPVTVFISACHGQFDALPTALTLAALLATPHSNWKTGLFLGFGVLSKSWPVLAWPQIMANLKSWRKRVVVTIIIGTIPLIAIWLYAKIFDADPILSLRKAVSYNWGTGIWGYTYFLRMTLMRIPGWPQTWAWFLNISRFITLGVLGWIWLVRTRFQSPVRGFFGILLGFFAWGHAFSIQYLLWPVAFAVYLQDQKWLARYILGASAYMFLAYYTLIFQNVITRLLPWPQADWYIIIPAGIPVWFVTVFWLQTSLQKFE
jgi:hypothetical protein